MPVPDTVSSAGEVDAYMNSHGHGTKRSFGSHNRPSDTPTHFLSNVHFRPSLRGPIRRRVSFIGREERGRPTPRRRLRTPRAEGSPGPSAIASIHGRQLRAPP